MPATGTDAQAQLTATATTRLQGLDPLLPVVTKPPSSCGRTFSVRDGHGRQLAIGGCDHWVGEPSSLALTWGVARRFRLTPVIAGAEVARPLDQLLTQWRDHVAEFAAPDDDDNAAVVNWPSRDVDGVLALLRHGLTPSAVIAARRTDLPATPPARPVRGVVIRAAGPGDLDAVTSLGLGLVRYDAHFGSVILRPDTKSLLRDASAGLLASPEPWSWLAERAGVPVGLLAAEPPEVAQWLAPLTSGAPAAYLQQEYVQPAERGSGIGALLTDEFHAQLRRSGVPLALLHYSQVNPLAAPFWSQQGYRPLWTTWQARPARTLR